MIKTRKKQYEYSRDELLDINDVEYKTLGEVVTIKHGKDYKGLGNGDIPVYGSGGIMTYVDTYSYNKPTVLIPRKGTITNIFYVDEPFWNVDTIYYTEIDIKEILPKYLYFFMKTVNLEALNTGSGRPSLTMQILAKIKISLPPLSEQKQIVSIIEKWDKYIELLDKKIEIKKNTKKYLQQVLLTGKVRLKGYEGEWEEVKFGDIGQCLRGVSYKPLIDLLPFKNPKSYFLLRSNNIQDGKLNLGDIQIVKENRVSEKQVLQLGDIIICMANGSKKLVGKSVKFNLDSNTYTVGAFMGIFRIKDPSYRSYINELFDTNKYRYYISNLLSGSSINNLKPSDIESMSFIVPPSSKERYAISSILTKSDKEIKTLEKQKQLIEQQRKYLINNLVTGKIRIPKFKNNK